MPRPAVHLRALPRRARGDPLPRVHPLDDALRVGHGVECLLPRHGPGALRARRPLEAAVYTRPSGFRQPAEKALNRRQKGLFAGFS